MPGLSPALRLKLGHYPHFLSGAGRSVKTMGARVVGQFAVAALYERRRCSGISTGGHRPPLQKLKLNLYGRAAAEFVNLYSKWRGVNRFPALTKTFELLCDWPEAMRRGVKIPEIPTLEAWIASGQPLGNPALETLATRTGDPVLKLTLEWSKAVNRAIEDLVEGVPPFPFFRESAEKLAARADIICVSQTPGEALEREWREHKLARFAAVIAAPAMGSKKDHLELTAGE